MDGTHVIMPELLLAGLASSIIFDIQLLCSKNGLTKKLPANSSEMDFGLAIHVKRQEAGGTFHLLLPLARCLSCLSCPRMAPISPASHKLIATLLFYFQNLFC